MAANDTDDAFAGMPKAYVVVIKKATGLRSAADTLAGEADPYVRLTVPEDSKLPSYRSKGKTKLSVKTRTVRNNLSPRWNEAVLVVPGTDGRIDLKVFNNDNDNDSIDIGDGFCALLGSCKFNCNVVASENWLEKILPLGGHPDAQGTLTINVRRYSHPTINIRSATGLKNVGNKRSIFLKSNPYAKITGLSSSKNPQETEWARTTIKADTCDPKWNEKLECRLLNEGDTTTGGKLSQLVIELRDDSAEAVGRGGEPVEDQLLGLAEMSWTQVWPARKQTVEIPLDGEGSFGGSAGSLKVTCMPPTPPAPPALPAAPPTSTAVEEVGAEAGAEAGAEITDVALVTGETDDEEDEEEEGGASGEVSSAQSSVLASVAETFLALTDGSSTEKKTKVELKYEPDKGPLSYSMTIPETKVELPDPILLYRSISYKDSIAWLLNVKNAAIVTTIYLMVKFSPFIYYNVCPIIWIGASFLVPVALLVAFCLGSVMVTVTLVMYLSPNTVRSLIYLNFVGSSSITKALSKALPSSWFFAHPARRIEIETRDGCTLGGWHVLPAGKASCNAASNAARANGHDMRASIPEYCDRELRRATRVFLYLHGQAGTRGGITKADGARVNIIRTLATHFDAHVIAIDYRGFGDSKAARGVGPTEDGLHEDARAAWEWIKASTSPECQLMIYGQSLGSGVAVNLAAHLCHEDKRKTVGQTGGEILPFGLILDAAFTSIPEAALHHGLSAQILKLFTISAPLKVLRQNILARIPDKYNNEETIGQVTCHILVLHKTLDEVVPVEMGRRVYRAALDAKHEGQTIIMFENNTVHKNNVTHHVDGSSQFAYLAAISSLLDQTEPVHPPVLDPKAKPPTTVSLLNPLTWFLD